VAWRESPRGTHAGAKAARPIGHTRTYTPVCVHGYRPARVGVPTHAAATMPHAYRARTYIHTVRSSRAGTPVL
jgi:hypothetical protein